MRTFVAASLMAGTLMGLARASGPEAETTPQPAPASAPAPSATVARHWYSGKGLVPFNDGYRAWELGDWKTTRSKMSKALEEEADRPELQVRTGGSGWITPYIPTYYLGLARCRIDKCSEKVDEVLKLIKDADSRLRRRHQSDCEKQKECPIPAP
jgi:hypothetical protein